jgi:microsomal epoxide hydrolase
MAPREYRIAVPDAVLDDLRGRLAATRWPDPLEGAGWDYGADIAYIRELCQYWRTHYDWRAHEAALNGHDQFVCEVDGVDLHFWHVRGRAAQPLPLMLLHGWPGSIYEFFELIHPLTDPAGDGADAADAFDVIVPALPGFGFGGRPVAPGWNLERIAAALDTLMADELGYRHYGVQGGDWGGALAAQLGSAHAEHVAGIHVNFAVASPPDDLTEDDAAALERFRAWRRKETGYSLLQGTKPDSLTLAQSDSPAGLAAWIVEKFRTWSDCGGDVESVFSKDTLLTNLMFYWAPNSAAGAARIYAEARRAPAPQARIDVPTAVAAFPREPWSTPRAWVERLYNVTRWTDMPRGGHFAALEQPRLLVEDVRAFFRALR